MEEFCQQMVIPFHPNLINPYHEIEKKMVNGIYADSNPMGDTRLLERQTIDPKVADQWRAVANDNFLSESTWAVAQQLGYEKPTPTVIPDEPGNDSAENQRQSAANNRRSILDQRRQLRQRG